MADHIERDTSNIETMNIGKEVDNMMTLANNTRKPYARNWYNNNFFDDGHHLRTISRTTGRIIDLSAGAFEKIGELKTGVIRVKIEVCE